MKTGLKRIFKKNWLEDYKKGKFNDLDYLLDTLSNKGTINVSWKIHTATNFLELKFSYCFGKFNDYEWNDIVDYTETEIQTDNDLFKKKQGLIHKNLIKFMDDIYKAVNTKRVK